MANSYMDEEGIDLDVLKLSTPLIANPVVYTTPYKKDGFIKSPVSPPKKKSKPAPSSRTTRSKKQQPAEKCEPTGSGATAEASKKRPRSPGRGDTDGDDSDEEDNGPPSRCRCIDNRNILVEIRNYLGNICEQLTTLRGTVSENSSRMQAMTESVGLVHTRVTTMQAQITKTVMSTAPMYPPLDSYGPTAHQPNSMRTKRTRLTQINTKR